MIARSIQNSILYAAVGTLAGSIIEGVIPPHADGASMQQLLIETAVQVGCCGVVVALMQPYIDDPTAGILFSSTLFETQPTLHQRLKILGSLAKQQVESSVLQMVPLSGEVSQAN